MLDIMRRQSTLVYVIFGAIIVVFAINFGPGSSGCAERGKPTWAAEVNGETLALRTFSMAYSQQLEAIARLAQRRGEPFSNEIAERLGLPKQVLDSLVERRVLGQRAAAMGMRIPDADLARLLRDEYQLKDLSYSDYEAWVSRNFDSTVGRFEEQLRADVAAQRLAQLVGDSLAVGDVELRQAFARDHERVRIETVRFAPQPDQVPEPPAAELERLQRDEAAALEAQYQRDASLYRHEVRLRLRQIERPYAPAPADHADADADDDTEADGDADAQAAGSAADANDRTKAPGKKAAADSQAEATAKLAAAAARLAAGEDFAQVAAAVAEPAPGAAEMGWLSLTELAPQLAAAVAELPAGGISKPVATQHSVHLLQVLERQEAHETPLQEVRPQVALALYRGRMATQKAEAEARALLAALQAGQPLSALTRPQHAPLASPGRARAKLPTQDLPVRSEPAWVRASDSQVAPLGSAAALRRELFSRRAEMPQAEVLPRVYAEGGSFFVVCTSARQHPDFAVFAADKALLREDAEDIKRRRVLRDWLTYLRGQAKVVMNPAVFGVAGAGH